MSKDINNYNSKGQFHGYFERYYKTNGKLGLKCFYYNDIRIDYKEYYYPFSGKLEKTFYI